MQQDIAFFSESLIFSHIVQLSCGNVAKRKRCGRLINLPDAEFAKRKTRVRGGF